MLRVRRAVGVVVLLAILAGGGGWWWLSRAKPVETGEKKGAAPLTVTTAEVARRDVPVRLRVNGSVVALQSVDVRAQVTSTVRTVHIREGQFVRAGELLVSLDSRADAANLRKAQAQVEKDQADLATARRDLGRQQELFTQKFISQAALDTAQNKVDSLSGQLAVDQAAAESARVALQYDEIRAGFPGRTGVIGVRPGSLVTPTVSTIVNITQVDPISVAFTLPQVELGGLQRALAAGAVPVQATVDGGAALTGRITFVDNAVDGSTGTIKVKAEFPNADARLWPGMLVNVMVSPRTMEGAAVVPAQAVQTGPDRRFVYVVGADKKVTPRPVTLNYVEEGLAVVGGVEPGTRVVVEGAQNLRPGATVAESARSGTNAEAMDDPRKGKGRGS